jgi:hypothetical protein
MSCERYIVSEDTLLDHAFLSLHERVQLIKFKFPDYVLYEKKLSQIYKNSNIRYRPTSLVKPYFFEDSYLGVIKMQDV